MLRLAALVSALIAACGGPGPGPTPIRSPGDRSSSSVDARVAPPQDRMGAERVLPAAALLADLALLEELVRTLHPGLERYNTPAQIDALFASARVELGRDRTLGDAFLVLTRLTAALRCGHSYPNFSNQAKAVAETLLRAPRLPLLFRWLGDRMVVTRDLGTGADLPPGTVIERVGDVATPDLLRELMPLARADGSNDGKRRAYLDVTGASEHEAFDVLAPLLHPELFHSGAPVPVTVLRPDGTRATIAVAMQSATARAALRPPPPAADAPLWQLERRSHRGREVAYLRMPTWVMYKSTWAWEVALHDSMAELARDGVPALIVDLRGNEGGNDVGDAILAHLITAPIPKRTTVRRVRFATVPEHLRPVLDTWDPSFFTLGQDATPTAGPGGDRWRDLPGEAQTLAPASPRYRGKLVVVVDAANSSATFQFAARVKAARLGTLVGSTTGGNQRGINGGAFFFARLPATGLEVDIPLVGTFPPGPMADARRVPDAGIEPDVRIELTAADLAAGRDRVLEAALDAAVR